MYATADELHSMRSVNTGRRLALVLGNFNVVHAGHIRLLSFARSLADILVVGLYSDVAAGGGYVPQELRLSGIRSLGMIDKAFVIQDDARNFVEALRPDVMVKGAEHEKRDNPEIDWLKPWNGRLVYCTDDPRFSLSDAARGIMRGRNETNRMTLPTEYLTRHRIETDSLAALIDAMSSVRVCVVGDLIVDEYVLCNPLGMSREDPTLVVSPMEEKSFVGGAGIVAGHASGLGGAVDFICVAGADATADAAGKWLREQGVNVHMLADSDRPTTVKRRYRAHDKTLLRVNRMSQQQISKEQQDEVMAILSDMLMRVDLLIFSDFSYGLLPPSLVKRIATECGRWGIPMTADSQTSSQIGDLAKFKDTLLVTPTELEARHAMRNFNQGLVALIEELRTELNAKNVVVTLGESGCLIYSDPGENRIFTDQLPSLNQHPVDVAGAGDSFLTAASIALAAGGDIWRASLLGSIAAGVQVGRVGNIPLTLEELAQGLGVSRSAMRRLGEGR